MCVPEDGKEGGGLDIMVVYVDDLLASGNETVRGELLDVLNGQFSTQNLGELERYRYLG